MVSPDIYKSLVSLKFIYAIWVCPGNVGAREVMAIYEGCPTLLEPLSTGIRSGSYQFLLILCLRI